MKRYFYLVLVVFAFPTWAGLYPVITSIKTEYYTGGAIYTITQALLEVGSEADSVPPNGGIITLGHRHFPGDVFGGDAINFVLTDGKSTLSQLAVGLYNSKSKGVTAVYHSGENIPGAECVSYGYAAGTTYPAGIPWASVKTPGGCMMVPPADEWCKITTPEILLDHGTMTLKDAEGSSATSSVGVQCTTPTAVTFNLITNDTYVYLDEGKSEISVDNKPLNTKIDLDQGDSQLAIKDKLTGINSEGAHTGSSVLVMMPY